MPLRLAIAALLGTILLSAQVPHFIQHTLQSLREETITGYGVQERTLATWGDRLLWRSLPQGSYRVVRGPGRAFNEGGCLVDVDGDGQLDVVVNEGGAESSLVWFHAPDWSRHVIDTGIDAPDILPATLFGRRGVLLIQKRIQVRFYEIPSDPGARWPYQEVYSFYSFSRQGGLQMADVDGDGLPDILAGNYWIRSPEAFEMPWRLFAIEIWNETPPSAMLRLRYGLLTGAAPELLAVQREEAPARLARFEKPSDPRQLWIEHRINSLTYLDTPNSLDVADFDGDRLPDILIAEKAGAGRLMVLRNEGGGRFGPVAVSQGHPIQFAQAVDVNADGRPDILTISKDAISWWENQPAPPGTR